MPHQWPALVVLTGPQTGQCFPVRGEEASVGRSPDANIRLDSIDVSRQHFRVHSRGDELVIEDLGSANGTWVNGTRVSGVAVALPGDTLQAGDVQLQFLFLGASTPTSPPPPSSRSYDFGGVNGPVNAGNPRNDRGNQIVGTGNIHHGDRFEIQTGPDDGVQELFSGQGPGRVLMAVGLIVAMVGFGLFVSVIFSGMTSVSSGLDGPSPFEKEVFGLNAVVTGFSMFGAGGLLMSLGSGMSRAARRRKERTR